jgi:hypothetical protein
LDLRNLIDLGGFLEGLQDTRKDIKITRKNRVYLQTGHLFSFLWTERTGWGGGPVRPNRRCYGGLGARVRLGTERGARGGLEDVLTLGGERRGRPEPEVNRAGGASSACGDASARGGGSSQGGSGALGARRSRGRARRPGLPFMGTRARVPGGGAVQAAAASGRWLDGPRRARRLGRHGRAEANWVGPPGSAQLDRKCFFRIIFPVQR